MKFLKRITSFFLIAALMLALTACGGNAKADRISVVATIFPYYDFAKNVSGGYADVTMLIPPGSDIHSYEPTAKDIQTIQDCDLFIYNGGESDAWIDNILRSLDSKSSPKVIRMMDYVQCVREEDADHKLGDDNDEHIWTSPVNAENLTGIISSSMESLDNKNSAIYAENRDKYIREIDSVHKSIKSLVAGKENKYIVMADRFPIIYFTNLYGIKWDCAFPGCSGETEPSLSRISKLENSIRKNNVSNILKLDMSGNNVADTVAGDTGTKVTAFYSCETISQQDYDNNETYSTLMARNLTALGEVLS